MKGLWGIREVDVAVTLLQQRDRYLLQRRVADPNLGRAGLIGCFGGKIRSSKETGLVAVQRKLAVETNLDEPENRFVRIGTVQPDPGSGVRTAMVFSLDVPWAFRVEAREGSLEQLTLPELWDRREELTPVLRAVTEELLGKPTL